MDNFCDVVLVGDSLGSVLYNYKSTREVSLDIMIEHSKSVRMGVKKSLMVVDMPYKSYDTSNLALKNAKKIIKETKCDAVKLEGGKKIIKQIKHLIKNKINVMGHLGLLPQTAKGKFKSKGKTIKEKKQLLNDAIMLQNCGVFAIVLECVKSKTTKQITETLKIPTIGIGAGPDCDGQVLVLHDMLGITKDFSPRFLRRYADLGESVDGAVRSYIEDVRKGDFPSEEESY